MEWDRTRAIALILGLFVGLGCAFALGCAAARMISG